MSCSKFDPFGVMPSVSFSSPLRYAFRSNVFKCVAELSSSARRLFLLCDVVRGTATLGVEMVNRDLPRLDLPLVSTGFFFLVGVSGIFFLRMSLPNVTLRDRCLLPLLRIGRHLLNIHRGLGMRVTVYQVPTVLALSYFQILAVLAYRSGARDLRQRSWGEGGH